MWDFIIFTAAYFALCTLFFCVLQKPLFGIYNRHSNTQRLSIRDINNVYTHGIRSDFIIASYLTAIPLLASTIYTLIPHFNIQTVLCIYNGIMALAISLIVMSDTILYRYWQYKLDSSVFVYLKSPKGAFASVSALYLVVAFSIVFLVAAIYFVCAQLVCHIFFKSQLSAVEWWQYILVTLSCLTILACLYAIIRGLKIRPNNPSVVYYSKNPFFNHWALNPAYNLIYSLTTRDEFKGKFRHFNDSECDEIFAPLFPTKGTPQEKILNTTRPNILLVVWESLGAEFVESLGGKPDVAVNVDRLARNGVMFTRCTAGSFRTDRGLVCLLSGYLGQPTTSVIRYTRKLPNLPALPRLLKNEGYETTAVHGGDLSIMHKSDYYLASGHDKLISQKDFPKSAPTCKWGIHDGYMFDWLYNDIIEKTRADKRWFTTFQTLSSHEPFTVPYNRLPDDEVANSFAYTDHCFGKFIDKLKQTPAWEKLLVICVADHGFNISHHPKSRSKYAHIPLLMLGGAVAHPARFDSIISQTDLAATLLGQMGLPHDDFIYSRDVLADTYKYPFSFHTYTNGFMFTDATGMTNYDNVAETAIEGSDPDRERKGKAILQKLYEDLSNR